VFVYEVALLRFAETTPLHDKKQLGKLSFWCRSVFGALIYKPSDTVRIVSTQPNSPNRRNPHRFEFGVGVDQVFRVHHQVLKARVAVGVVPRPERGNVGVPTTPQLHRAHLI
jgi:hypothetical protein